MSKIDFTKPVQTVSGEPVEIIKTDSKNNGPYTIIGYLGERRSVCLWTAEGKWDLSGTRPGRDLMNAPDAAPQTTDTPRTDAEVEDSVLENKNHPHTDWVPASFARTLERELAMMKKN